MNDFKKFILSVKDITMPDIKKLFHWSYLTDTAVSTDSPFLALLLIFFVFLIIAGQIIVLILSRKQKKKPIYQKLRGHINNLTLYLGIAGIFFVLARFEAIYLFSARILLLLDLLAIVIWGLYILYYLIRIFPKEKKEYVKREKFNKYIPKRKIIR